MIKGLAELWFRLVDVSQGRVYKDKFLKPASPEDYADLVMDFLSRGARIGNVYSHPFAQYQEDTVLWSGKGEALSTMTAKPFAKFYIALADCEVPELSKLYPIEVAAPAGIKVLSRGSNNSIFSIDEPSSYSENHLKLFSDTADLMKQEGFELKEEHFLSHQEWVVFNSYERVKNQGAAHTVSNLP
jgi:hypothetical protein